jgi:glycine cleavage system aminomethyltransferase T
LLKKMIAMASVDTSHSQPGTRLQIEITIVAVRQRVSATESKLPFFNPQRKTAVPV